MAQRDMTKAEFTAALKRNGFKHVFMCWYEDTTGATPGVGYGALYSGKPLRLHRRATIAHLIKSREHQIKRNERKGGPVSRLTVAA